MNAVNGHGSIGPVELAHVAVRQQLALLADAKETLERAAATRSMVETEIAGADAAHAAAVQTSAADRSSDRLADAAGRASVRLQHARADLARAVAAYETASADVAAGEANVQRARQVLDLVALQAALADGTHAAACEENARAIVAAVIEIRDRLLAHRARLRDDATIAGKIRELGGTAVDPDGTSAAGFFLDALCRVGGSLDDSVHAYRWPWALPSAGIPDVAGFGTAQKLVALTLGAVARGARNERDGHPDTGRAELTRTSLVWQRHLSHATASKELEQLGRDEAEARKTREEAAHHERLRLAAAEAAKKRGMATGQLHSTPKVVPHPAAIVHGDGEYAEEIGADGVTRSIPILTVG
jgi:hypothetical protein